MSDETKNTTAPEPQTEQAATTEGVPKSETKGKSKSEAKTKSEAKPKAKADTGGALKSVGLDACKRHSIAEVWVSADGQSFAQENNAKAHAANLSDKQILNVKAK